jgi:hypothetical protein
MSSQSSLLNPVLVTGSSYSGVKAIADILAVSPSIRYEKSPFNIRESDNQFIFVTPENEQLLLSMNPLINPDAGKSQQKEKRFLSGIFAEIAGYFKTLSAEKKGYRMMVADTKLFFMAPWIHGNFAADVVVLLRHPFYLASLQKKHSLYFDFGQLQNLSFFTDKYLPNLKEQLLEYATTEKSAVENAAMSWLVFATMVSYYQREFPNWIFFKTEVFDMQRKFRECYQMLDLPFTKEISDKIVDLRASFDANDPKYLLNFSDISNLTDREIMTVRRICEPLYDEFYSN